VLSIQRTGDRLDGRRDEATPLRLLLVEDDRGDAYLTRALLDEAGVDAEWRHVESLTQIDFAAIEHWADCALVDLTLPDSEGLEAVKTVLDGAPWVPLVVVSGNGDRELALAAVHAGAQDYLVKGRINADLLAKTVYYAIERKLIEHQLHQAQQMAKLGRLAGGMAHHFNNLHAVILNYATFVTDELSGEIEAGAVRWEQTRRDVEQIRRAAAMATKLTRQLMTFAEQDIVQPEAVDINGVVRGVQRALSARVGPAIEVVVRLAENLPQVQADRGHVEQVLVNLTDNAVDSMPHGGRLTIETVKVDDLRAQAADDLPVGTYVRLRVSDTGSGIAEDILDRVFDPFFTSKPVGQGAGLGLAVVYAILDRSGGGVDIESTPGGGTTVTALFPTLGTTLPIQARPDASPAAEDGTILVVDDEDAMRTLVTRILEQDGYSVITAASGAAALEAVEHNPGRIDLLLADVIMPTMLGTELATRVTRAHPEIPVVFMSAYSRHELQSQGKLNEDVTLVEKPFEFDELLSAVSHALNTRASRAS